jgi:hypothetical protein
MGVEICIIAIIIVESAIRGTSGIFVKVYITTVGHLEARCFTIFYEEVRDRVIAGIEVEFVLGSNGFVVIIPVVPGKRGRIGAATRITLILVLALDVRAADDEEDNRQNESEC